LERRLKHNVVAVIVVLVVNTTYWQFYISSMSVLLTVGLKCMLIASHAAPWWVTVSMPTGLTDRRTDVRLLHHAFR